MASEEGGGWPVARLGEEVGLVRMVRMFEQVSGKEKKKEGEGYFWK